MLARPAPERLSEALIRATQHWAERHAEPDRGGEAAVAVSVAVSREVGANGTAVAREVGRHLGWAVYDHELVEHIAREMDLRVRLVESVDEKHASWLEQCIEAFSSARQVSENAYVRNLVTTILSLGAHGSCVVVGRGAPFILPAERTLRVRLVADRDDRVAAIAQERGLARAEAARFVEEEDRRRAEFVAYHFHQDVADPLRYDLVVNTSNFGVANSAEVVVEALHRRRARLRV